MSSSAWHSTGSVTPLGRRSDQVFVTGSHCAALPVQRPEMAVVTEGMAALCSLSQLLLVPPLAPVDVNQLVELQVGMGSPFLRKKMRPATQLPDVAYVAVRLYRTLSPATSSASILYELSTISRMFGLTDAAVVELR